MAAQGTISMETIAAVYTEAAEQGLQPTKAVAAKLGLPPSTANKKVMAARAAGLLAPTKPGASPRRHPSLVKIANELGVAERDLRAAIFKHVPSGHICIGPRGCGH